MSGYLGDLSARQQAALDKFREAVADVRKPSHTDAFLLRWLRAFVAALTSDVVQRHCVYMLEYAESLKRLASVQAPTELETHYLVIDVDNFSLRQVYSWQAVKTITDMLQMMEDHFPECLEKCIIINAPYFFPMVWKLMKPFLTQRTTDKVEVFAKADLWKERLISIIDAALLPAHWGGDMVGPDGDPRCRHKVNYGGRFEEGPNSMALSLFDEPGVMKQTIGRRGRWEFEVNVSHEDVELSWCFQTAAGDLGFGLRMRDGESLLPVRRIDASGQIPQEGSWRCTKAGTYVLEFDNSYSWLTEKKLAYVVKVQAPNGSI
ncbi:hypothetical protein HPB50_014949 [Hyalomma asiaticum]|uniref:Uncharacterized protein n=1 Tax=Hyalomma asiaticum TaxID=266040 RepID=A0ACB7S6H7_HYAAI|nr:hypothetical protein HPB50_014949 [Hyalomma asiaticum]